LLVAGARPNFMKIAPICEVLKQKNEVQYRVIHTGQHYDINMSKIFFEQLDIPQPDINLNVGSQSHAVQTANIMIGFEKVLKDYNPDVVIVVGDVNSTLACSLVAVKMCIPVAHVEAGLRSFNWDMPEEINRVLTDRMSQYLFTSCEDANENLIREGIEKDKIFFVGNVMIDTLMKFRDFSKKSNIINSLNLKINDYAVLTMHRPSNVDDIDNLSKLIDAFNDIQKHITIIYPVHPRTKQSIINFGFEKKLGEMKNFVMVEPLGYLDFLHLMTNARFVITDSGGIQEESTILGIPCLTIRKETERPVTIKEGTNVIVGNNKEIILTETLKILHDNQKIGKIPSKWDGKAAQRIVDILLQR
jgi:UDP-N-acetylglucosamine 2-epimerase (non-hydrolysing)